MALEFVLGVSAGLQAGSILLIAFGLDALLEVIAGGRVDLATAGRIRWC